MIRRFAIAIVTLAIGTALLAASALAAPQDFGLEAVEARLTAPPGSPHPPTQAGAHPDLTLTLDVKQDPASSPNSFGLRDSYAATRDLRFDVPPGLVGDPNVFGLPQQCPAAELAEGLFAECPNGSQVGTVKVYAYGLNQIFTEPLYMMVPPGGDVVARLGFVAGIFPTFVDFKVRSESDYGLVSEVTDASAEAKLIRAETTIWGVPAASSHDTERCTPGEVFSEGCIASPPRPPGSAALPFLTNPTRCAVPLSLDVSASSWPLPDVFDTKSAPFPPISGCEKLPFGPDLAIAPTSRRASSPTGLDITLRLPGPAGSDGLEPSQMRDIRIVLPEGMAVNPGAADGLTTCSVDQVRFGTREPSACPDAAKIASTEFAIPALPRRMKGAIYLREPQPGNLFRVWVVADDLGAHVKLPAQLEIDERNGQIASVLLDTPQVPLREAKLFFFPGERAPLLNPPACGTHTSEWEFTPWSGTPAASGRSPMRITEGCDGGGFAPKLAAGTTDPAAGRHAPFLFTLTRSDGEANLASLDVSLPPGLAASFRGVARCEGAQAATGSCPPASRVGYVRAAVGAGSAPLWVPQPGKRPTAVYLGGPYRGAPLSIVAVVPAQAGPFDLGDEVVRSAIFVDPRTAQATVKSDPLPQIIEGIPVAYRTIHVELDRPNFTLNPSGCAEKRISATVTSDVGSSAKPSTRFQATDCASLGFKPRLSLVLKGGAKRGDHPALKAVLRPRPGDSNIAKTVVTLPRSAFLDQAHIRTICTRVQFAADSCPAGSVYGKVKAISPLLEEPLTGNAYLRSSDDPLPNLVFDLHGLVDIEAVGRIDSVRGGIRASFDAIPDAPLTRVEIKMQGGTKGLIVNSRNLCEGRAARAEVKLRAHNGRKAGLRPVMGAKCGKAERRGGVERKSSASD